MTKLWLFISSAALAAAEDALVCREETWFEQRFDGMCNNQDEPDWGAHLGIKRRQTEALYQDDRGEMVTKDRPSPRDISNTLCDPDASPNATISGNFKSNSLLLIYFGQFLDHDMALVEVSDERADIHVDVETDVFEADLIFRRSLFVKDSQGRRQFENENTAFLDLSNIYGDTTERAQALRKLDGSGELRTLIRYATQEYLPLFRDVFGDVFAELEEEDGSLDGSLESNVTRDDEEAPVDENFACGDIRCNENPVLLAITTLWVRNHNRLARQYAATHPKAEEDGVFYQARRRNIMMYQSIIYTEWLPALLGKRNMAKYSSKYYRYGYQEMLNPGTSVVFSTAAFRFGHSGIADIIVEASPEGKVSAEYRLAEVFFQPSLMLASNVSFDSFLSGVRVLQHEALDTRIVNAIRNTLFGNVDLPLDLAALNIQRGRDHGLNTFNTYRKSLGLEPYVDCAAYVDCWQALTRNAGLAQQLRSVYNNNFDAMDIFVAGMAEYKLGDSHLGETFTLLILQQFETFRHGDRFWYEHFNLERFADVELPATMTSVIEQNTQTHLESHLPAFITQSLYLTMHTVARLQLEWVAHATRLTQWQLVMETRGRIVYRRNMSGRRLHYLVRRRDVEMLDGGGSASYTIRLIGKFGPRIVVEYRYWLVEW